MGTVRNLEIIKKQKGSWAKTAKELGITYRYLLMLRKGIEPGKFLSQAIERKIADLDGRA